ncbi:MAG: hypothetical protein ACJ8LG_21645 [Massilia sp.]
MSLQNYDFTVAANGSREISAPGRFVYYRAGTTPLIAGGNTPSANGNQEIKLTAGTTGASVVLMPGQSLRLPADEKQPSVWRVANSKNSEQITGQIIVGEGDFNDNAINSVVSLTTGSVLNNAALPMQKQAWSTITTFAPVVINTGAAQLLVSDNTQRALRIRNTHPTATIYLGDVNVTAANAALAIGPGQLFLEDEAAGAGWYATADVNGVTVAIQGLKL